MKLKEKINEIEEVKGIVGDDVKIQEEVEKNVRGKRKDPDELIREKLGSWKPITKLGKKVKEGKIKNINEILDDNLKILEPEIVDSLIKVESDLLFAGQSKGKFGGGKRRAWRQSQKKTKEGNIVTFSALVIVGDKNGHLGFGFGKAKETLPAREKALRKAKLNIFRVRRGSGSFDDSTAEPHSIPMRTKGKCGSCKVILMPAPRGTGLVIGDEGKKILRLAGIENIYSQSFGQGRTTMNYAKAIISALKNLEEIK
ncbi:MAG: 30S ribosomal protein S5 [Candidatus Pacearchaeota archaeon]